MADLYQTIRRNRRLVWIGIWLGYGLALATVMLGLNLSMLPTTIALGVAAALPPTIALISLDRRPALLPAASIGALVFGFIYLILLLPLAVVALIWCVAYLWRPVPVQVSRLQWWARVGLGIAVSAAVFVMFIHPDPRCESTVSETSSASTCSSDTVVPWEAGLSLLVSGAVIAFALRWPVNQSPSIGGESSRSTPVDAAP